MPERGKWLFKISFCDPSSFRTAIKLALTAIASKGELNAEYVNSALNKKGSSASFSTVSKLEL